MSYHPCGRVYLYRNRKEFELRKPESLSNGPPFYLYTHTPSHAREPWFLSQKFHCWLRGLHSTISCIPSSERPLASCQHQHCDKPYSNSVVASLHGRCHSTASWVVSYLSQWLHQLLLEAKLGIRTSAPGSLGMCTIHWPVSSLLLQQNACSVCCLVSCHLMQSPYYFVRSIISSDLIKHLAAAFLQH